MVIVFHKGIRKEGLLRKDLQLWWSLGRALNKSAGVVFQEQYPDSSFNFQILIETPDDDHETKGLKFINNNLSKLLDNKSLADIQFVFKDDQVPAHSAVIAASSPVFAVMFEGGRFKEGQTRTVDIEDIDSRVFRKLLQFLYTGSSGSSKKDPSDVLQALFLAADKYQVDALRDICEECLICQLKIENVHHLLVWAHLYGAEKLKEAAVAHIVKERHQVWKLKEWEELSKNNTDLFFQICNRMFHYDD
jgi:speckle-type POZ protein